MSSVVFGQDKHGIKYVKCKMAIVINISILKMKFKANILINLKNIPEIDH